MAIPTTGFLPRVQTRRSVRTNQEGPFRRYRALTVEPRRWVMEWPGGATTGVDKEALEAEWNTRSGACETFVDAAEDVSAVDVAFGTDEFEAERVAGQRWRMGTVIEEEP